MNYLRNYSDTALCCGYSRTIGLDFSRQKIYFFDSKIVSKIIESDFNNPIDSLIESNANLHSVINELIENEILFVTTTPELFPKTHFLEESYSLYDSFNVVFNEIEDEKILSIKKVISACKITACKFDLRNCSPNFILNIASFFSETALESIEFVIRFTKTTDLNILIQNCIKLNLAISRFSIEGLSLDYKLEYFPEISISEIDEGFPKIVPSQKLFNESFFVNSYYFKKLFLNENGDFKTGSNPNRIISNLSEISCVDKILNSNKIDSIDLVKKDLISVCNDCEFRYICVDNRIPTQRKDGTWFFETECSYNPYISKWSYEDGYKTLEECGVKSNENLFSINQFEIELINQLLWGDE